MNSNPNTSIFAENVCEYPNGIEYFDHDILIIGCGDGLYRIYEGSPSISTKIGGTEFMNSLYGIAFNKEQSILYVTINGAYSVNNDPVLGKNQIAALSSKDKWLTADVLYIFNANCEDYPMFVPTTLATYGGTIHASCMSFDVSCPSPNRIKFITDAETKITNGNKIYGASNKMEVLIM